jgi:hypothetical protein
MAEDPKEPSYTREEVEEILRRALQRPQGAETSEEELLAVAREAGIPEESVRAAARELEATRDRDALRQRIQQADRVSLRLHAGLFALVNLGLLLLNLATNQATVTDSVPRWWFVYPFLAWGIGLAVHAARVRWGAGPSEEALDAALARGRAAREAELEAHQDEAPRQEVRVRVDENLVNDAPAVSSEAPTAPAETAPEALEAALDEPEAREATARADRRGPPRSEG